MDAVDLLILDQMTSPTALVFGGLDPRHSPEIMADRVGLPASSIRTRMNGWRAAGFLVRWNVLPHPAQFDMEHYVAHVRAAHPSDRPRLAAAFGELEGSVACFEQVGGVVGVGLYAPNKDVASEHIAPLMEDSAFELLSPPGHVVLEPPNRGWDAAELEAFRALRTTPDATVTELAKALETDESEVDRLLGGLAESGGLYTLPELDFTRFHSVLVRALFDVDGDPRAAYDALAKRYDLSFYRSVGTTEHPRGHAMACLRSIAMLDDLEADILQVPGVTAVTFQTPRRFRVANRWMDQMVAKLQR